jgi:molybdate transport system ATP-binding protein
MSLGLAVAVKQAAPIPLDATLDCAEGELLALVGPSGAGKTTILRAVAGLLRPREGRIACGGAAWFDAARGVSEPPQRRRVGLVFQDYALFPHMTALENVASALGHLPRGERGARAKALLAQVHLDGLEDRRPARLSGGQAQRVALARALARDPAVLLLDEPFAAVDQVTRRKLQRELAQLRGSVRVPTVLVTHDLVEAAALADRMTVLHHGRTLQTAPPREVLDRPASPLVARLMDQPNVFAATLREKRAGQDLCVIHWHGYRLEARDDGRFALGATVAWVIPPSAIVLHTRMRPSRGERENPIAGTIAETLYLGDQAAVTLRPEHAPAERLVFAVSAHTARRNDVAPGAAITVSLLADGIHLMPPE